MSEHTPDKLDNVGAGLDAVPTSTTSPSMSETEDQLVYTNEGFEKFLQQAELAGISRQRQDELIAMFLAEDVSLETVLLDTIQRTVLMIKRNKLRVLLLVLMLGLLGFVWASEYRARRGYQDYQPWQFEISAKLKTWQIKYMKWIDFDGIFHLDCLLYNPYYFLTHQEEVPDVDCVNAGRELSFAYASSYSGVFNSKKFPLPLVLNEAQSGWVLDGKSTLEDFYKVIAENLDESFPCVNYMGEEEPASQWARDPLRALIDGKLAKEDGTSLNVLFMDGCSRQSNRLLRGLTKRPVFLDPHIEALHAIKGIAAKGIPKGSSAKATIKPYDPEANRDGPYGYYWLAQVIGKSVLTLRDLDCADNKPEVYTLRPGDIVAVGPEDSLEIEILGPGESLLLYTNFKVKP
ncbi:hypothetical protein ACHWQZ_G005856 [Mnemiopsis leidyi]